MPSYGKLQEWNSPFSTEYHREDSTLATFNILPTQLPSLALFLRIHGNRPRGRHHKMVRFQQAFSNIFDVDSTSQFQYRFDLQSTSKLRRRLPNRPRIDVDMSTVFIRRRKNDKKKRSCRDNIAPTRRCGAKLYI